MVTEFHRCDYQVRALRVWGPVAKGNNMTLVLNPRIRSKVKRHMLGIRYTRSNLLQLSPPLPISIITSPASFVTSTARLQSTGPDESSTGSFYPSRSVSEFGSCGPWAVGSNGWTAGGG